MPSYLNLENLSPDQFQHVKKRCQQFEKISSLGAIDIAIRPMFQEVG